MYSSYSKFAILYATLCFFLGIAITAAFDKLIHVLQRKYFSKKKKTKEADSTVKVDEEAGEKEVQPSGNEEGDLIASIYTEDSDSSKLIRMGIFAGLALAFHVCILYQHLSHLYLQ